MNAIWIIYVALIAFSLGHAIGWHRGRNYGEDSAKRKVSRG